MSYTAYDSRPHRDDRVRDRSRERAVRRSRSPRRRRDSRSPPRRSRDDRDYNRRESSRSPSPIRERHLHHHQYGSHQIHSKYLNESTVFKTHEERSRSSERHEIRRSKRVSLWDVPPSAKQLEEEQQKALDAIAAKNNDQHQNGINQTSLSSSATTSGSVHPSRLSQVGNSSNSLSSSNAFSSSMNTMNNNNNRTSSISSNNSNSLHSDIPRQARRIYVGNLPLPITEIELRDFIRTILSSVWSEMIPGDPVQLVYLNLDKKFAFLEFRNPDEASTALALDGINFKSQTLRFKRPSDWTLALHGKLATFTSPPLHVIQNLQQKQLINSSSSSSIQSHSNGQQSGVIASQVPDGPNKVFAGGLPYALGENEVKELLQSFGPLRSFHLVTDRETRQSKGYCFFEYIDANITDAAIQGLNDIPIGEKTLTVRRAAQGRPDQNQQQMIQQQQQQQQQQYIQNQQFQSNQQQSFNPSSMSSVLGGTQINAAQLGALAAALKPSSSSSGSASIPTRILVLRNMCTIDELRDPQEYDDIKVDVQEELEKYGKVKSLHIPRPIDESSSIHTVPGLGAVFIEFESIDQAIHARLQTEGRKFGDQTVTADYHSESKYNANDFS